MTPAPGVMIVAVLSLGYLCSSDIFALINYVGFATWISIGQALLSLAQIRPDTLLSLVEIFHSVPTATLLRHKEAARLSKGLGMGHFLSIPGSLLHRIDLDAIKIMKIFEIFI